MELFSSCFVTVVAVKKIEGWALIFSIEQNSVRL